MYKFRRATEAERREWRGGTHNIRGYGASEEDFALFLGKAMTVFGQPDEISNDWESMYSYLIIAEDEQGNEILLEVYHGPSGSAIGGKDGDDYKQASEELIQLILLAEPTDYEHESVYYDIPANVRYTVKGGKAYTESSFPEDMDPEDFM